MRVSLDESNQAQWNADSAECLRYEYDLTPDDLVVDIGAYRGDWASAIHHRYGSKLIVIEPGPWITGFEHGDIINRAAATYNGTMKFGGAYYYASTYEEPTHEYPCFDINELIRLHRDIALLKLNIEGGEYALLNHIIEGGLQHRIRNLQVQFHLIEDQPCRQWYDELADRLTVTHELQWRYPFVWESWRCRVNFC